MNNASQSELTAELIFATTLLITFPAGGIFNAFLILALFGTELLSTCAPVIIIIVIEGIRCFTPIISICAPIIVIVIEVIGCITPITFIRVPITVIHVSVVSIVTSIYTWLIINRSNVSDRTKAREMMGIHIRPYARIDLITQNERCK